MHHLFVYFILGLTSNSGNFGILSRHVYCVCASYRPCYFAFGTYLAVFDEHVTILLPLLRIDVSLLVTSLHFSFSSSSM